MKRKLIFLISTMLICSSIFAQNHYTFNTHNYQLNMGIVAQIKINGVEQTSNNLELGAFKGESIRGSQRIGQYGSAGYYRVYIQIYGDPIETGYEITFKLFNHNTGEELDNCNITYLGEPLTVTWSAPNAIGTNKKPVTLDFITSSLQTFTKEISAYTTNGGWYLIASPLNGEINPENVGGMLNNNYDLYRFNQSAELEWENWKNQYEDHFHFNLESGQGYLYANSGNVTLSFTGTPVEGNTYEVSLVKEGNTEFSGWNLVGNPFAEHTAYIDRDCFVMNTDGRSEIIASNTRCIEVMEGAFVIATENDEVLTFSTEAPAKGSMVALNLCNDCSVIDRTIVRFGEGHTLPKLQLRDNNTKIYISQDDIDYAVVYSKGVGEMPVNFKAKENGFYTIGFSAEEVSFGYLHLIDNMTGNDVDLLATPSYSFEAKDTDYASRFKLVYATINGNSDDNNEDFAFYNNGSFVISNEGMATFQVVDIMGRIVKNETINGYANIKVNATPGIYMLRLINGNDIKLQKVVIRQ